MRLLLLASTAALAGGLVPLDARVAPAANTYPHATAAAGQPRITTGTMPGDPAHPRAPWSWEPGMSLDPRGWVWVAGNHCSLVDNHLFDSQGLCHDPTAEGPIPTFAPVWVSKDGGRSYSFVADPLSTLKAVGGASPGGEDTDIAVQPSARPGRAPLLYVVSSWGLSATLAISGDDGVTWRIAQVSGAPLTAAGIDRPWLATSGTCDLFLQYHPLSGSQNLAAAPRVDHFDGCALFDAAVAGEVAAVPLTSTAVEPPAQEVNGLQVMAKLVATAGRIHLAYTICDNFPEPNLNCNTPADHQSVHVATSSDSGASWQDATLPDGALKAPLNDGVWPMSLAADGDHLAVAITDTSHVHLWTSADGGRTWRVFPGTVDSPLGWSLATVPSVAVRGTAVSLAWYGSGPAPGTGQQEWRLVLARSVDAGRSFAIQPLDPVLATTPHGAPLVDLLYDDFGALIAPDGATLLAYTQSCAGKAPTDHECPGPLQSAVSGTFEVVRYARIDAPTAPTAPQSVPAPPDAGVPNTSR